MPLNDFLFTSESVSEGHPDKMCDQISDAVLDALIAEDPDSRVALESLVKTGLDRAGRRDHQPRAPGLRENRADTAVDIGYNSTEVGFDGNSCAVLTAIEPQSADISQGVTEGQGLHKEQGAGDQGLMFGFRVRRDAGDNAAADRDGASADGKSQPSSARAVSSIFCGQTPRARSRCATPTAARSK